MIHQFRTWLYAVWRACERFGLLPPEIKLRWEDNSAWAQCQLLGYDHIRQYEQIKEAAAAAKVM